MKLNYMLIKNDAEETAPEFKTPLLASIYNACGWLVLLALVLFVAAALTNNLEIASLPILLSATAAGVLMALCFFGIAQFFTSVAEIEYHTGQEQAAATLRVLRKIEAHLASMRESNAKIE